MAVGAVAVLVIFGIFGARDRVVIVRAPVRVIPLSATVIAPFTLVDAHVIVTM